MTSDTAQAGVRAKGITIFATGALTSHTSPPREILSTAELPEPLLGRPNHLIWPLPIRFLCGIWGLKRDGGGEYFPDRTAMWVDLEVGIVSITHWYCTMFTLYIYNYISFLLFAFCVEEACEIICLNRSCRQLINPKSGKTYLRCSLWSAKEITWVLEIKTDP